MMVIKSLWSHVCGYLISLKVKRAGERKVRSRTALMNKCFFQAELNVATVALPHAKERFVCHRSGPTLFTATSQRFFTIMRRHTRRV